MSFIRTGVDQTAMLRLLTLALAVSTAAGTQIAATRGQDSSEPADRIKTHVHDPCDHSEPPGRAYGDTRRCPPLASSSSRRPACRIRQAGGRDNKTAQSARDHDAANNVAALGTKGLH